MLVEVKVKPTTEDVKDHVAQMEKMRKELGDFSHSQGSFAEEYFFNAFEKGKKDFFGTKFKDIAKNLKSDSRGLDIDLPQTLEGEYDIVMYNDTSVAIVEVKFKVRRDDLSEVLRKAQTFKILSPKYKNANIYLGVAALVFPKNIEQECIKKGIAVIKQVGDTVVIIDENLKAF
jgi:hypothetical protein